MCFSTAKPSLQKQPAFQTLGIMLCLVERHLERVGMHFSEPFSPARLKGFEGETLELIKTTQRIQTLAHLLAHVALATDANFELAEARIAHRNIGAQIALSAAVGAVRITETSAR